ncbi:hypothetical protein L6164_000677 [Bauhinia variegata]|uniref:Uncharacterized protein n=1 Tax=Bauhinia variegata TaxID=167791 RepID=A0ACB9Q9E1_BAUVA|nr:hypothetical protein L6164_000677 [Bauhinia variegata]
MTEQGGKLKAMDGNVSAAAGDGTNWWWALSSASLFGWGIASFAKGCSGDSRLMPVKAFGVASLFVGGAASASVVVLQYYGIRKVEDAMEVGATIRTRLGLTRRVEKVNTEDS